jgi:8-oxo-dGTP pyrophosphatase MutT (NUDIX family)
MVVSKPEPVRKRGKGERAPRPKDAATLIVYRIRRGRVEVLMGQRHAAHSFLPYRYAFPGGRVDPTDSRVRPATPMRRDVAAMLERKATPARARGLIAAAIRETFEETGLLIAGPDPAQGRSVPAGWQDFFATGGAPDFGALDYVARAVTPHWRPFRYNARFFMADSARFSGDLGGTGELLNLHYVSVADAVAKLELPLITTRVLEMVDDLALNPPRGGTRRKVPNFVHNGKFHDIYME